MSKRLTCAKCGSPREPGRATARCRKCVAEYARDHYRQSPRRRAKMIVAAHNRRARRQGGAGTLKVDEVMELFDTCEACPYCRVPNDGRNPFELDHAVPVVRGGANDLENVELICRPCNQAKRDMLPSEYRDWLYGAVSRLTGQPFGG